MTGLKMKYAVALGSVLLLSGAALAFGPGHGSHGEGGPCMGGGGMGHGAGSHMQALGLSADQQKQVTGLESKLEADVAPLRSQMVAKRTELQALWSAPAPDRKAILAKQAEMEPLRDKMRTAHVDFRLAVQKVLTPEQRERWMTKGGGGSCAGGCGPGAGGFGGGDHE